MGLAKTRVTLLTAIIVVTLLSISTYIIFRTYKPTKPLERPTNTVLAYFSYQDESKSWSSLKQAATKIEFVSPSWYRYEPDFSIAGRGYDKDLHKYTRSKGLKLLPLLSNYDPVTKNPSKDLASALLSSEDSQTILIANIMVELAKTKTDGINLDLEGVPPLYRNALTSFVEELHKSLQSTNKLLVLSVPAKAYDNSEHSWAGAFDYNELGKYADFVVVMAYNESYESGKPGPITSNKYLEQVCEYAKKSINPTKIVIGLSGQGLMWENGVGKRVSRAEINNISATGQGNATEEKGSVRWVQKDEVNVKELWYDNISTITAKVNYIKASNIQGVALWNLGNEPKGFWQIL